MKINGFPGELTDRSAKKDALVSTTMASLLHVNSNPKIPATRSEHWLSRPLALSSSAVDIIYVGYNSAAPLESDSV